MELWTHPNLGMENERLILMGGGENQSLILFLSKSPNPKNTFIQLKNINNKKKENIATKSTSSSPNRLCQNQRR